MARHSDFRFHWRYEREEITHLCIIDDLMMFCKAEVASNSLVRNCLDQFWVASGSSPNPNKSNICSCVVLLLIQKYSFSVFSDTGKENYRLGIFFIRVDFNFSSPSSSLFRCIGLVSLFFLRLLWWKKTSLLRSFLWKGSDLSYGNVKVLGILFVCLRRKGVWV
jgi:hypothetical protein